MTVREMISILEASLEGKRIEMFMDNKWQESDMGKWVSLFTEFRVAPEAGAIYCGSSPSQKRAEKSANESGFKYHDDQRSGFIYGYEQCIKDFGITLLSEPRKPREFWLAPIENGFVTVPKSDSSGVCIRVREVIE